MGKIEEPDRYCYLRIMLNKEGNLKEHIKETESKATPSRGMANWRELKERIEYSNLMLIHSIISSDKERISGEDHFRQKNNNAKRTVWES